MDYAKAFRKPFTDVTKLFIGIVLSIFPILNWFAKGYILECSGLGKNKPSKNMPNWKNGSDYFVKGLIAWVIGIIYMIPTMLIFLFTAAGTIIMLLKTYVGVVIPQTTIESVATGEVSPEVIQAILQQNWAQAIPVLLGAAPLILLAMALAILAAYIIPAATLSYLKSNDISFAFTKKVFSDAFSAKYFVAWIITLGVTLVLSALLNLIPFVGNGAMFFISGVIGFTLFGEVLK